MLQQPIGATTDRTYNKAKELLTAAGHQFERARREWGFEYGVFCDGAHLGGGIEGGSDDVVSLAEMAPAERKRYLAEVRADTKDAACHAVTSYMAGMQVSIQDLLRYLASRTPAFQASSSVASRSETSAAATSAH